MAIYELEERVYFDGAIAVDVAEVSEVLDDSTDVDDIQSLDAATESIEDCIINYFNFIEPSEYSTNLDGLETAIANIETVELSDIIEDLQNGITEFQVPKLLLVSSELSDIVTADDSTFVVEYTSDTSLELLLESIRSEVLELNVEVTDILIELATADGNVDITGLATDDGLLVTENSQWADELTQIIGLTAEDLISDITDHKLSLDNSENIQNAEESLTITQEALPSSLSDEVLSQPEILAELDSNTQADIIADNSQLVTNYSIYIIDSAVEDTDQIIDEIPEDSIVVELGEGEGIEKISEIINSYTNIDSIHIVSEANYAQIMLGNDVITDENISDYQELFSSWNDNLTEDADILFYGCDIAKEIQGQNVVTQISEWTGADVAASTDITGGESGDWDLEYSTGNIESEIINVDDYSHHLETYTVTSADDTDTAGTLRWAINQSNTSVDVDDTINIQDSIDEIEISSQLPTITDSVTINGGDGVTVKVEVSYAEYLDDTSLTVSDYRVFSINALDKTITISNMTIHGGDISKNADTEAGYGGGIYIAVGTVELNSFIISGSCAYNGGGIYNNEGTLTVINSTIEENTAAWNGGGIDNDEGTVVVKTSTFSGNEAVNGGGGVYNYSNANLSITFSTISNNEAGYGGGINNTDGILTLTSSTVCGNTAIYQGGGIYSVKQNSLPEFTAANSIIAYNWKGSGASSAYQDVYNYYGKIYGNYIIYGEYDSKTVSSVPDWGTGDNNTEYTYKSDGKGDTLFDDYSLVTGTNNIYQPELALNGGTTKTVALADGSIAEGTGIFTGYYNITDLAFSEDGGTTWKSVEDGSSVTQAVDKITEDQRGVDISELPCVGAFYSNPTYYYYRTDNDGDWSDNSNWEVSANGVLWRKAENYGMDSPDAENSLSILVQNDITVDNNVNVDQTTINENGSVTIEDGIEFTVVNGTGDDLTISGTISESGTGSLKLDPFTDVVYDGGDQTIIAADYYNLTAAGTGVKTVEDGASISKQGYIIDDAKILITVTATAEDKTYDGTVDATVDVTIINNIFELFYSVSVSGTGTFDTKNAGDDIEVTVTLSLDNTTQYTLGSVTTVITDATISAKELTVSGMTDNKTYDGTVTGDLDVSSASLDGVISGDSVSLNTDLASVSDYSSKNAGTYTVTVSGLSLDDNDYGNYTLGDTVELTDATIRAKELTVSGMTDNKTYDGTATGDLDVSSASLDGVISGDSVSLNTDLASVSDYSSKNAGTYTVTVSGLSLDNNNYGNYTLGDTVELTDATIRAKELTVSGMTDNKTYDGTATGDLDVSSASLDGVISGDSVSLNTDLASVSDYSSKNAGTYTVTVSGLSLDDNDYGNYTLGDTVELTDATIRAKELTVSGMTDNKTYDGTATGDLDVSSASLDGVISGDSVSLNTDLASVSDYSSKNAGTYTVTVSGLSLDDNDYGNYTLGGTVELTDATIRAKELTVSGMTDNKTYDGTATGDLDVSSASLDGVISGDSVSLNTDLASVSDYSSKNAGTYTVTVSGLSLDDNDYGNYTLGDTVELTDATIRAKELTVSGMTDNKTYDGTATGDLDVSSASLDGVVSGDSVSLNTDLASVSDYSSKNAGTYTVTVSGLSLDNNDYGNYTLGDTVELTDATIRAKELTVSGMTDNKTYDGTATGDLDVSSASLDGVISGDSVSLNTDLASVSDYSSKNAGTYTVTVSGLSLDDNDYGNYTLGDTVELTDATIRAKELTVSGMTDNKTYDGTATGDLDVSSASLDGVISGDSVSLNTDLASVSDYSSKNAGTYTVTVSGLSLDDNDYGNYTLGDTVELTDATIRAKELTVSGMTDNKTYDGTATGDLDVSSASLDGVISGDSVSLNTDLASVSDYSSKNAGTYTVTVSGLSLDDNDYGNYTLGDTVELTDATIRAKELTVSGMTDNKTYDGTATGDLDVSSASLDGVISGDSVSLNTDLASVSDYSSKNAGTYTVTVSGLSLDNNNYGNYTLGDTVELTDATIRAKELTVSGMTDNKTYDGTATGDLDVSSASLDGVISGDSVSLNTDLASVSDYSSKNAGTYTVTVSGLSLDDNNYGNYTLGDTVELTDATIRAKELTVSGMTDNKTYDGTATGDLDVSSASLDGVISGDSVSLNTDLASVSDYSSKNAGTYTVTVSGLSLDDNDYGNYTLGDTVELTDATIRAKELTVSGMTDNKTYDGTATGDLDVSSASLDGVISGDSVSLNTDLASVSDYSSKNAGTYTVTVSGLSLDDNDYGNYTLGDTVELTDATIRAKELTVSGMTDNKTYDGTATGDLDVSGAELDPDEIISGDSVSLNTDLASVSDYSSKNAGTYTVTVSGLSLDNNDYGNYTLGDTVELTDATIRAKELTVSGMTDNKTYDGTATGDLDVSGAELDPDEIISGDSVSLNTDLASVSDYSSKNAGTYTVTVSGLSLDDNDYGNYTLGDTVELTDATIRAKELTVSGMTDNKTYDGTATGDLDVSGAELDPDEIISGDSVSLNTDLASVSDYSSKNAGTYTVTVSGLSLDDNDYGNYTLGDTVELTDATIRAKELTVSGMTDNKTYDGTATGDLDVSGAELDPDEIISGDSVSLNTDSASVSDYSSKNAGTYTVTVSGLSLDNNDYGNYTLGDTVELTDATIRARQLTVNGIGEGSSTYGDFLETGNVTFTGAVSGDDVTLTASILNPEYSSSNNLKAGSYKQTVENSDIGGSDAGNYTVSYTPTADDYTVYKLALAGSIAEGSSVYGDALNPGVASFDNALAGDDITAVVSVDTSGNESSTGHLNAGSYDDIEYISSLTGTDASNYTYSSVVGDYEVSKRVLIVSSIDEGSSIYGGDVTPGTVQWTGGVDGDDISVEASISDPKYSSSGHLKAGSYNQTVDDSGLGGDDNLNYTISYYTTSEKNYTVNKLEMTVNIIAYNKVYDGTVSATVSLSSDNILVGDTVNISYDSAEFADKNVGTELVIVKSISIDGTDADNYSLVLSMEGANITTADITPKDLSITADNVVKGYGDILTGETGYTEFNADGLVVGENIGSVTVNYGEGAEALAPLGVYEDSVVISDAVGGTFDISNYTVTYVSGNIVVTGEGGGINDGTDLETRTKWRTAIDKKVADDTDGFYSKTRLGWKSIDKTEDFYDEGVEWVAGYTDPLSDESGAYESKISNKEYNIDNKDGEYDVDIQTSSVFNNDNEYSVLYDVEPNAGISEDSSFQVYGENDVEENSYLISDNGSVLNESKENSITFTETKKTASYSEYKVATADSNIKKPELIDINKLLNQFSDSKIENKTGICSAVQKWFKFGSNKKIQSHFFLNNIS